MSAGPASEPSLKFRLDSCFCAFSRRSLRCEITLLGSASCPSSVELCFLFLIACSIWCRALSTPFRLLDEWVLGQSTSRKYWLSLTYFLTPFCRPSGWLGIMHSACNWVHRSHRRWSGDRLHFSFLLWHKMQAACLNAFPCCSGDWRVSVCEISISHQDAWPGRPCGEWITYFSLCRELPRLESHYKVTNGKYQLTVSQKKNWSPSSVNLE